MVEFKIYDITDWTTNNCNTNIVKGNQTLKFGQLIEYNMRNIIFKESYSKCGGEARIRPFYEKSKFGSTVSNAIKFVFIICPS